MKDKQNQAPALEIPEGPKDLHTLTALYGSKPVAEAIGVSYRNLLDLRHGYRPLTVDHLYELLKAYPDFDALATVRRIGEVRADKECSYRYRHKAAA
jgi:hypothetical protein